MIAKIEASSRFGAYDQRHRVLTPFGQHRHHVVWQDITVDDEAPAQQVGRIVNVRGPSILGEVLSKRRSGLMGRGVRRVGHRLPGAPHDLGISRAHRFSRFKSVVRVFQVNEIQRRAALRDRPMEQSFGQRRDEKREDATSAGGFAEDGHPSRITAKSRDIALHPAERFDLVEQTVIAAHALFRLRAQLWMGQKAERTESIVDADDHGAFCARSVASYIFCEPAPIV